MDNSATTNAARPAIELAAILVVVIAGLSALDRFLAASESAEVRGAAERSYRAGAQLLEKGNAAQALEPLRNAHAMERDDPNYETKLATALVIAGRTGEASPLIDDLLQRKPDDAEANLIAARMMLKEGRASEAGSYYHRAIYGEWLADARMRRMSTRLELIRLMVAQPNHPDLMPELISLEAEADGDVATEKILGQLFLLAGAPARSANVYRALLARDPEDASAYEGLGEAELEQGDYRAARAAFLQASYHHPDQSVAPRLELLTEVTTLDPTPRKLESMEKYTRSMRILDMARADLQRHIDGNPTIAALGTEASTETAQLLKEAADAAAKKTPRNVTNEMAEAALDLAEKMWKARIGVFGAGTAPDEEPLRLIMEKLGEKPAL
jgi:tetratricopeptide (TPR) repeat protein